MNQVALEKRPVTPSMANSNLVQEQVKPDVCSRAWKACMKNYRGSVPDADYLHGMKRLVEKAWRNVKGHLDKETAMAVTSNVLNNAYGLLKGGNAIFNKVRESTALYIEPELNLRAARLSCSCDCCLLATERMSPHMRRKRPREETPSALLEPPVPSKKPRTDQVYGSSAGVSAEADVTSTLPMGQDPIWTDMSSSNSASGSSSPSSSGEEPLFDTGTVFDSRFSASPASSGSLIVGSTESAKSFGVGRNPSENWEEDFLSYDFLPPETFEMDAFNPQHVAGASSYGAPSAGLPSFAGNGISNDATNSNYMLYGGLDVAQPSPVAPLSAFAESVNYAAIDGSFTELLVESGGVDPAALEMPHLPLTEDANGASSSKSSEEIQPEESEAKQLSLRLGTPLSSPGDFTEPAVWDNHVSQEQNETAIAEDSRKIGEPGLSAPVSCVDDVSGPGQDRMGKPCTSTPVNDVLMADCLLGGVDGEYLVKWQDGSRTWEPEDKVSDELKEALEENHKVFSEGVEVLKETRKRQLVRQYKLRSIGCPRNKECFEWGENFGPDIIEEYEKKHKNHKPNKRNRGQPGRKPGRPRKQQPPQLPSL